MRAWSNLCLTFHALGRHLLADAMEAAAAGQDMVGALAHPRAGGEQVGDRGERGGVVLGAILRHHDAGIADKIGRASCRESVCQYVSIAAVAVSLQQQTTSTKPTNTSIRQQKTKQN